MKTLKYVKPGKPNHILVTLKREDKLLVIQTIDHRHGKSDRFLASAFEMERLIVDFSPAYQVTDFDIGNILRVLSVNDDELLFRIYWLDTPNTYGDLKGVMQQFTLSPDILQRALTGEHIRILCRVDQDRRSRVTLMLGAQKVVSRLNKHERRALCKFLRNAFQWGRDAVVLCSDGEKDFFFRTTEGLTGGVILHRHTYFNPKGEDVGAVVYSLHT